MSDVLLNRFLKSAGRLCGGDENRLDESEQALNDEEESGGNWRAKNGMSRQEIESRILESIKIDDVRTVKLLQGYLPDTKKDPLFLCSAINRACKDCVDFYLEKGTDIHASVEGFDEKGIKGDAALWIASKRVLAAMKDYETASFFYHGKRREDHCAATWKYVELSQVIFYKVIAREQSPKAWKSDEARVLALRFADEAAAYGDPSKSLNARKLPKSELNQG